MKPLVSKLTFLTLAVVIGCASAVAQGNLSFSYQRPSDSAPIAIANGDPIPFPATNVGSSVFVTLFVTNPGNSSVTFQPSLSGDPAFSISNNPVTVPAVGTAQLAIGFNPASTGAKTSTLTFSANGQAFSFTLNGGGNTPQFTTSYIAGPNGNQTAIANGGTLIFVPAQVNTPSTATFIIQNTGGILSQVNSVSVSGSSVFKVSGLPLLPANVAPGGELHFTLTFSPTARTSYTGTLTVQLGSGTLTITLSGQGSGAVFTVENVSTTPPTVIPPNGALVFASTSLGKSTSATIRVRNDGDVTASINTIAVVGVNFTLNNVLPPPITLQPGTATTFQVVFSPKVVGDITDRLLIDSLQFDLKGTGTGPKLDFTFTVGSATTTVADGGIALFPNTLAGSSTSGILTITNSGNLPGTVTSVSVSGSAFAAQTSSLSFPAVIQPSSSLNITLVFSPNALGTLLGTLTIDNAIINLRGTGSSPAAIPSFTYTGTTGSAGALQQPSIGLQLNAPYPIDITGKLTLTFTPTAGVDDPTIQFAQVGRTVNFTIPANTTEAFFGQLKQVQFSTGTVAGTITVTPSFAVNGVDNTPSNPLVNRVVIAAGPPVIRNVQVGTRTPNSFELLITGYSTAREVSGIVLLFSAPAGKNLITTSLNLNVSTAFGAWYQSAASSGVGSQFTVSITINVSGDSGAVQAVSVGASDSLGASNAVGISL